MSFYFRFLIHWAPPLLGWISYALGPSFFWFTPFVIFGVFPILECLWGKNPSVPRSVIVEKKSLSRMAYEGVMLGYLGLSGGLLLAFAYKWFDTSEKGLWALWFIMNFSIIYALMFVIFHEALHRIQKKDLYARFLMGLCQIMSQGSIRYNGHIIIHHHSYFYCSLSDFSVSLRHSSFFHFLKDAPNKNKELKISTVFIKNIKQFFHNIFVDKIILVTNIFIIIALIFVKKISLGLFLSINLTSCLLGTLIAAIPVYIQHYGLIRPLHTDPRYHHRFVWNCDFIFSNYFFLNLPRHTDHHLHAQKPYWELSSYQNAPQLPYGYLTLMVFACVPRLFFKIMDPLVDQEMAKTEAIIRKDD